MKILIFIDKIIKWTSKLTSLLILPLTGVVSYSMILRYAFHYQVDWGYEIALFIYGIHFMLGGAYCSNMKGHVAIDLLINKLPISWKKLMTSISYLVTIFVCIEIIYLGGKWAWDSTMILEHSGMQTYFNPPIWWYKWIVPISGALMLLQAIKDIVLVFCSDKVNCEV